MSFKNHTGKRGTYIAVSDRPDGEFTLLSETPATPEENSCIDGTLYVEDGTPYIVYSLDWPHHFVESEGAYVGEIWARELSEDLSRGIGEPFRLFSSNEAPNTTPPRCSISLASAVKTPPEEDTPLTCSSL